MKPDWCLNIEAIALDKAVKTFLLKVNMKAFITLTYQLDIILWGLNTLKKRFVQINFHIKNETLLTKKIPDKTYASPLVTKFW